MFSVKLKGRGEVTPDVLVQMAESIGKVMAEELEERDEQIRKLRRGLETERRLRLSMKSSRR